jgi:HD-like signal output (HDOD) protein/DNA-binding response OmpR family regulator
MNSILIIDDMPLFRLPLAAVLRSEGFTSFCAEDGRDGLDKLRSHRPDLILLDLMMPVMDGMGFMRALRRDTAVGDIPVILLTEMRDRKYVVDAAKLGVRDYLLKSKITPDELVDRIKRLLDAKSAPGEPKTQTVGAASPGAGTGPTAASTTAVSAAPAVKAASTAEAVSAVKAVKAAPVDLKCITPLLTSQQCVQRVEACMAGKTLSGAVAEVMMLAGRPSAELKDLSALIARDSVLSVRVLQMANSAAFFSRRGSVTTVTEAVRNIGATNVRNIAASVGIFDAMPTSSADGFNPIRCWQHSFAVARLCEAFVTPSAPQDAGVAYLVGLCHDLGEIMFRTQFESEYQSVLDEETRTGAAREDIELRLLGMTHTEILKVILRCMGLPESIRNPIERFQRRARTGVSQPVLLRALSMAESYANGLWLVSSESSLVCPFTEKDWLGLTGDTKMRIPDGDETRSQVYCLTAILSRLNSADQAELLKPPFKKTDAKVWLARNCIYATVDPVATALGEIANVEVHDRLPTPAERAVFGCVAIEGGNRNTPGWSLPDIEKMREADMKLPVLWLVNETLEGPGSGPLEPANAITMETIRKAIHQALRQTN